MADETTPELGKHPVSEPKRKKHFGWGLASQEELKEVEGKATVTDTGKATRKKNLTQSDDTLPDTGTETS